MLDAHSKVAIPEESHFIVPFYEKLESFGDLGLEKNRLALINEILSQSNVQRWDEEITLSDLDLENCTSFANILNELYSAYARKRGKQVWGDKTPSYTTRVDVLNRLFPDSKFIHIFRDGRDVASSIISRWWGANDLLSAISYWAQSVTMCRRMLRMLPDNRWIEIRFEDLVARPEEELSRLCEFMEIEFEKQMVEGYSSSAREKLGDKVDEYHSHTLTRPQTSQAYKWKQTMSPVDQSICFEVAGNVLSDLGYETGIKQHFLRIPRKGMHRIRRSIMWRFPKIFRK
jgi:hypothetical protein